MENVNLPELGEGIDKAVVACWHVKVGDHVSKDQDLVELVTDKATFSVAAPVDGVVKDVLVKEGQEVPIGARLAHIRPGP